MPIDVGWQNARIEGMRIVYPGRSKRALRSMRVFDCSDYAVSVEDERIPNLYMKALRESGLMVRLRSTLPFEYFLNHVIRHGWKLRSYLVMQKQLSMAFETALRCPEITAWACMNDVAAVAAITFLLKKRKRIPEDISITGCDNMPLAQEVGLTTCDLRLGAAGRAAIEFLARGKKSIRRKVMKIKGKLVTRETTGPAPRVP